MDQAKPAFKPRKVKKSEGKYRDRAAERRVGDPNDYAEVEAVLEEFEKRTADQDEDAVDEQRRYLGGDTDHSILVKGLDMALLQQNKAKAAMATDEDDSLEQAYIQASSEPTVPKKRTREDIIRELKEKRAQGGGVSTTPDEPSLNKGKFKPIGFKPIGSSGEQKEKKKKTKGEGERKKKKRKVEIPAEDKPKDTEAVSAPSMSPTAPNPNPPLSLNGPEEPEPPEDFDIFAGAGEYEGVDLGDDEEEENEKKAEEEDGPSGSLGPGRWFATDEQPNDPAKIADNPPLAGPSIPHPSALEEARLFLLSRSSLR
ncbi:hypothetical protein BT96DRAFT_942947 [Gymnopus androsaceus JB14]|uniref:RED-like N-terminal domain-containing protein n=1 Tax=Gymnopus androsaceus JB14 TaxID=1447944 RepID=A0A6A4HBT3_9AGAR|nr:hypothetical protein BT96DRAFT_942947 [Gymnopus androsaceus JB14]